ncbi:MAG: IS91 family transposase, partial [Pseudomonadota bacterium]|nr:IS91 family transposase [Pseudomonadota bacterium]
PPDDDDASAEPVDTRPPCPCCGGHMIVIETFERGHQPRAPPSPPPPSRTTTP